MTQRVNAHFTDRSLLQPTNPISVNLIGAGGTGSHVLSALARIDHSLVALQHPGLFVTVFDDDKITRSNLGRQLFSEAELGLNKSSALVSRINRFFGTNWKAVLKKYNGRLKQIHTFRATITISCVDTVKSRFEIGEMFGKSFMENNDSAHKPLYWMDFGNNLQTGQVILSTIQPIPQPASRKFKTTETLPLITEEFGELLKNTNETDTPSCSLVDALNKQDLFINSSLANLGASLLWSMLRQGMIFNRGFFLNLHDLRTQPLKVT